MRVKTQVSIFIIKHLPTGLACWVGSEGRHESWLERDHLFSNVLDGICGVEILFEIHGHAIIRWLLSSDRAYRRPCEQTPLIPIAMRNSPLFSTPDVSDYKAIAAAVPSTVANSSPNCHSSESLKYRCGSCASAVSWRCSCVRALVLVLFSQLVSVVVRELWSYRMVLPVRRRIHWGIGRFCFCALASFCFVRKDLWDWICFCQYSPGLTRPCDLQAS
jgi:hypothetical protein